MIEPQLKKISCPYCGDASINHTLSYWKGLVSIPLDNYTQRIIKHAPRFIEELADFVPVFLFKILLFFGLASLSGDVDKANNFRSRIIWEEAKRRGIKMEQLIFFGKPLDYYRALLNGRVVYFESIPIPSPFLGMKKNWDDKVALKQELRKKNIPVPFYLPLPFFHLPKVENIFSKFTKPVIIKPRIGSRGRHTLTNICTLSHFITGINIAKQICPFLVVEEHLWGDVCRATLVGGLLAGFQKASAPSVVGDGRKTIRQLILEKDNQRPDRVGVVHTSEELHNYLSRSGFSIEDVLPSGVFLPLSHRMGRLWGGKTKEMIDDGLHPSFIPILEKAAKITGLVVLGFDCIVPDPTKDANSQKWGIIECNTLPFIDLHYYTLEGKPRNIAGMIWDLWK